jgi:hypothetical protein
MQDHTIIAVQGQPVSVAGYAPVCAAQFRPAVKEMAVIKKHSAIGRVFI